MPASRRSVSRAPSPHGATPAVAQPIPETDGLAGGQHDFEAVLARVSGAGDEQAARVEAEKSADLQRTGGDAGLHDAGGFRARVRTLHRDHGEIEARLDCHAVIGGVLAQPLEILFARARIDDHAKPLVVQVIDDEVVDDAAVVAQHARIERLAGLRELGDVVGEQAAQVVAHAVAAQVDHAHVRDVEHARVAAHGMVLLDLRAVVDRHVPAAEIDGAGARSHVRVVERSAQTHFVVPVGSEAANKKGGRPLSTTCRPSVLLT